MNKIERVRNALHQQPVDVIPASFWFHFPAEQRAGQAMAEAHLAYYNAAQPDFLKVMNDNGYALTGIDKIDHPTDWRRLRPAPQNSAPYRDQLDGLKRIVDDIGDEALVITTIFNPYATGNDISGGQVTAHLHADPAAVSAGLATIAESLGKFAAACIAAGAAGIYFSAQGGERERFETETWESYVKSHDVTVLQQAEKAGATFDLLHICSGNIRLDGYADYPAHAVNWATQLDNLSLTEGRKLFGQTLVGGVDQRGPIVDSSHAEITREVRAAVSEAGRVGFIVGAGCTVPNDIAVENLAWAIQAAHEA